MNSDTNDNTSMFLDDSNLDGLSQEGCILCEKNLKLKDFPDIISKALSRKFCSNLNHFFYTKDINRIIAKERCHARIELKEWLVFDFNNEYCKRFYGQDEYKWKLDRLQKHYKPAVCAPKMYIKEYMRPVRRFYYYQEKMLRLKGKGPIIEDEYETDSSESSGDSESSKRFVPNILKDLSEDYSHCIDYPRNPKDVQHGRSKFNEIVSEINSECFSRDLSITLPRVCTEQSDILIQTPTESIQKLNKALERFDYNFKAAGALEHNSTNSKCTIINKKTQQKTKKKIKQSETTQGKNDLSKSNSSVDCSGRSILKANL